MTMAFNGASGLWRNGLRSHLVYGALLPLFMLSEGVERLGARMHADVSDAAPAGEDWLTRARSQASIATSYALTARRLLQSSERRRRPERPS